MDDTALAFRRSWWMDQKHRTWGRNFYLGVAAAQSPYDMWLLQEIFTETRPDLVVECGSFMGGSALHHANILEQLGAGTVATIDIDPHWRYAKQHRLAERIEFVHGSTADPAIAAALSGRGRTMVILDSDHSYAHVSAELELWGPLVTPGCYLVVMDTVADWPDDPLLDGKGPWWATRDYLKHHPEFERDATRARMMLTCAPGGWLRRREEAPAG